MPFAQVLLKLQMLRDSFSDNAFLRDKCICYSNFSKSYFVDIKAGSSLPLAKLLAFA